MGQFKPMVKMMTTEPSVELKLKKGGHVSTKHKSEHGHKAMKHMMDGGVMSGLSATPSLSSPPPMMGRGSVTPPAASPMRPSLSARRRMMKAMPASPATAGPTGMAAGMMGSGPMKKGGKVHHHAKGGDVAQDKALIKKAFKQHDEQEHKGAKGTHLKLKHGGMMHKAHGGNVSKFENTEMHTASPDRMKDMTGEVKESNAGGYKHGGKVHHISGHAEGSHEHHKHMAKHHSSKHKEGGSAHHHKMHEHHKHMAKLAKGGSISEYVETKMEDGEHHDSVHGTGGIKVGDAGGFKHGGKAKHHEHHKHGGKHHYADGGSVNWENRPADTAKPGVTNTTTGGVKESNAGGFKKGGQAKKHFATGGAVNNSGHAVAYPKKQVSAPIKNSLQSGTFKKGGKVMKMAGGGDPDPVYDREMARKSAEQASNKADNEAMREMVLGLPKRMYEGAKDLFSSTPPSGSVTKTEKSVTVAPAKKRGGSVNC